MGGPRGDLADECRKALSTTWTRVLGGFIQDSAPSDVVVDQNLRNAIHRCVNSRTKTYRYVLPTQLVAKAADSSLDCRCVQVGRGGPGAFDARSICDAVIVPFDKANDSVLGGSPEPYVNNPLRVPEITQQYRDRQKDKKGWDDLCVVLDQVETANDAHFTESVFEQTLVEVYRRLSTVRVTYPIPKRISLKRILELMDDYLSVPSGGERALAITFALLQTIGTRFNLFAEIRRARITAANASSGQVADVECISPEGKMLLAVEVKDSELTVNHVKDKLPSMRSKRVSEILFIAQKGIVPDDAANIEALVGREFVSGQNIYIFDLRDFAASLLALLGEDGRREFLEYVGKTLDEYGSAIRHRQDWAALLSQL